MKQIEKITQLLKTHLDGKRLSLWGQIANTVYDQSSLIFIRVSTTKDFSSNSHYTLPNKFFSFILQWYCGVPP
jgi:hypothetical protein